jgi:outer membrane protein
MNRSASVMTAALLALATASQSLSQETQSWGEEKDAEEVSDGYHWGLGAGFGLLQKAYVDIDSESIGLPILIFDNRWISVRGPVIDFKLPLSGPVSFALRARYSRDGYEASDSPALLGMTEREASFWYGAAAVWRNDVADVSVDWLTDASDYSSGQRAKLTVERGFEAGKFEFTPRVSATWLSDDYVDYYFGVSATEALPLRAAYQGDAAVNFETGLRTTYRIKPKHSLFLDVGVEALDSVIEDSPIVDTSTQSSVFLGYVYMFR